MKFNLNDLSRLFYTSPIIIEKVEKKTSYENRIASILKTKSKLSSQQIRKVLKNQKLLRYYRWFITIENSKKDLRLKYRLYTFNDIKNHILYQDNSGKTKGCGCRLCLLRNFEYRKELEVKSIRNQRKKLETLELAIENIKQRLLRDAKVEHDYKKYGTLEFPLNHPIFDLFGNSIRKVKEPCRENVTSISGSLSYTKIITASISNEPEEIKNRIRKQLWFLDGRTIKPSEEFMKLRALRRKMQHKLFN